MAGDKSSSRASKFVKFVLLAVFVITRALHPLLIDWSKQDGKIRYGKNTPVVMNKILTVALMNLVALVSGGMDGVMLCWQPKCLVVFGMIGSIYALGDFLEMLSMASLTGGVYQTLLQTKLLITALMLWWIKGTRQTRLQWHVLFAMFLAMSSFVILDQDSRDSSGGGRGGLPPLGAVTCVMLKVAVSCYCAVLSEKYLKAFASTPLYAKISGISTTWAVISWIFCLFEKGVRNDGFFAHWNSLTWLVTISFVVKTVLTMSLLQALDSVQKNIGEALAVLAIYISQVYLGAGFELAVFLVAALVVALVKTYGLSSPSAAKSSHQRVVAVAKRFEVLSLNREGTSLMTTAGVSTVVCEVTEDLPEGLFYGMLGDAHPVCGSTHANRHCCELMLLNRELSRKDGVELPFLPRGCLTVLGRLHSHVPREKMSLDYLHQIADESRDKILAHCMGVTS